MLWMKVASVLEGLKGFGYVCGIVTKLKIEMSIDSVYPITPVLRC